MFLLRRSTLLQIDKYAQREILVHCQLNHPYASILSPHLTTMICCAFIMSHRNRGCRSWHSMSRGPKVSPRHADQLCCANW